jgi:hypothetical protein
MREEGLAKVINLYPDYFTFTFVRNPFARFVSIWKHSERGQGYYFARNKKNLTFKEYTLLIKEGKTEELSYFDRYHIKKQVEFILDCNQDTFWGISRQTNKNCDFIGRFENLKQDFKQACQLIGIPKSDLPQEMVSPDKKKIFKKHYSSYYDPETIAIVKDMYAEDLDFLGYDFK